MPINFVSPTNGATVTAPFPVTISYTLLPNCTLSCTVEGVTRTKQVSGQGSWTTPDFDPSLGTQSIDAATDAGDLISISVTVT